MIRIRGVCVSREERKIVEFKERTAQKDVVTSEKNIVADEKMKKAHFNQNDFCWRRPIGRGDVKLVQIVVEKTRQTSGRRNFFSVKMKIKLEKISFFFVSNREKQRKNRWKPFL